MNLGTLSFIVYAVVVFVVGLWAGRRSQRTASEIHLGDREHGAWTSALSSSASTESGFVLLGMVGMGYTVGANALWIVPAGVFGYLLNWLALGSRLRAKSVALGAVTVPELISGSTGGGRGSRLAGALAGLLSLVFLVAYVTAQFSAAGKALSVQMEISNLSGVIIGAGIVGIYTVFGGYRAVSWTDNVQAIMMVIALLVLPATVVAAVGGPAEMVERLRAIDPALVSLTAGATGQGAVMAVLPWLMLGLAYPGQPHALARLMSARDDRVFRPAAVIAVVWFVVIYTGAVVLGMAARAGFAELPQIASDPETTLPVLAVRFLPDVLAGITVSAIIAAICSTADSTLYSAASTLVRDFRAAIGRRPLSNELLWMRVVIGALTVLSAVLAVGQTGVIFEIVLYAWSGLGASLGPTVLYCAWAPRPRWQAAVAGLLVGGSAAFLLHGHALDLLLGFCAGGVAITTTHLVGSLGARGAAGVETDPQP